MYIPSISCPERVICRPTLSNPVFVFAWTSTFSNPAELNFARNQDPSWQCQATGNKQPLLLGWSMFTGLLTLSCAGCQPSWLNGLERTCRTSWGFPTNLIRGLSQDQAGPQRSWTVSCRIMFKLSTVPWAHLAVWNGVCSFPRHHASQMLSLWLCLICLKGAFIPSTQRFVTTMISWFSYDIIVWTMIS
jgi:hypothetical protein